MSTILLVDDDLSLAGLMQYALEREGFAVRLAHTGQDALHALREAPIDLAILDVHLPDMNGFTLLAALREFSQAPAIMLTGSGRDEAGTGRHGAAPDDYVVKPFSAPMLVKRIKGALQRTALTA